MSKYIDKDELWERLKNSMVHHIVTNTLFNTIKAVIDGMPTIEIVRCKDCKHWHEWDDGTGSCQRSNIMWVGSDYEDYCSFAEPKGSDTE